MSKKKLFIGAVIALGLGLLLTFVLALCHRSALQSDVMKYVTWSKQTGDSPAAANAHERKFERVWTLLHDNFLFADRLPSLAESKKRFAGKLASEADTETAINELITSLGDEYSLYLSEEMSKSDSAEMTTAGTVSSKVLAGEYQYIKISEFSSKTAAELSAALKANAAAVGYLIDLRGNAGGDLEQALLASSNFCDEGVLQRIEGKHDGKPYEVTVKLTSKGLETTSPYAYLQATKADRAKNVAGKKPVVVLIDDLTASAAEVFAGILADLRKAPLVGEKSFGKAICQDIYKVDGKTSVLITFAKTYRPSGACINGKGIVPDVAVRNVPITRDVQKEEALRLLTEASAAAHRK
jgi:C-terminal processing protease CtpA/Prc